MGERGRGGSEDLSRWERCEGSDVRKVGKVEEWLSGRVGGSRLNSRVEEFIALDPISRPSFARFSPNRSPDCFLLFFLILLKTGAYLLNLIFFCRVFF